jgi:hypothetical protein
MLDALGYAAIGGLIVVVVSAVLIREHPVRIPWTRREAIAWERWCSFMLACGLGYYVGTHDVYATFRLTGKVYLVMVVIDFIITRIARLRRRRDERRVAEAMRDSTGRPADG